MNLFYSLLVAGALAACQKEEVEALPAATEEGLNTAGCRVDGQLLLPHAGPPSGGLSNAGPIAADWLHTPHGTVLAVSFGDYRTGHRAGVGFRLKNVRQPGTYVLDDAPDPILGERGPGFLECFSEPQALQATFRSGPLSPATITLTRFDTVHNIVAGRFEGRPQEVGGSRTVSITEGRFDIRFERR